MWITFRWSWVVKSWFTTRPSLRSDTLLGPGMSSLRSDSLLDPIEDRVRWVFASIEDAI